MKTDNLKKITLTFEVCEIPETIAAMNMLLCTYLQSDVVEHSSMQERQYIASLIHKINSLSEHIIEQ